MEHTHLEIDKVQQTLERLYLRISDRFPQSGLANACQKVLQFSKQTERTIEWISRPILSVRCGIVIIALLFLGLVFTIGMHLKIQKETSLFEFIQASEAGVNEVILLFMGFWFLWSLETTLKRRKVVQSLNKLRDMAHIIDMHQLTKDPDGVAERPSPTSHSPKRELNAYELGRYLDYCSEMLSLLSKLGYFYISKFDDPVATDAANDLENLANGLSRKIWQKIMILRSTQKG
jgi:hypothetical protein